MSALDDSSSVAAALAALGLAREAVDDFDLLVAEDAPAAPPPEDDGGLDDEAAAPFATAATAAQELVEAWLARRAAAPPAEVEAATAAFWEGASGVCRKACRAFALAVSRRLAAFLAAPAAARLHAEPAGLDAAAAAGLYWAMLRVPGAQAYGVFDANVMRRSLASAKRLMELAAASAAGAREAAVKRSRGASSAADATNDAGKGQLAAASASMRQNPRRAAKASQHGREGGTDEDRDKEERDADEAADGDDYVEAESDDEEDEDEKGKGRRAAAKAGQSRRGPSRAKRGNTGTGAGEADSATIVFSSRDVAGLCTLLHDGLLPLLREQPLRSHQECIPLAVDVLAAALGMPAHVCAAAVPGDGCEQQASSSIIVSSAACLLALLQPKHASPLTTARIALKRLKPFMLHGHGGTGAAASAANSLSGGSALALVEGDDDILGGAAAAALVPDVRRPACPPDLRVVRARALYFTRVIVSDRLSGRVMAVALGGDEPGGEAPAGLQPIPNHVLVRLPAVTALLQHLCVGAVSARAEVRAITCDIIAHLRACLPHSLRRAFVRFLASFARSGKAGFRLLAVEVAARLLGAHSTTGTGAAGVRESAALDVMADGDADGDAGASSFHSAAAGLSPLLAVTLAEMPVPCAADCVLESEGYGQDGVDYAEGAAGGAAAPAQDDAEASGPASPDGSRRRRSSIVLMGAANAHTPALLRGRGAGAGSGGADDTPLSGRISLGGRSRGPGSPFYGRRSLGGGSVAAAVAAAAAAAEEGGIDGCCDPRPTATILVDLLLRRANDRGPGVRAKAVAALAGLVEAKGPGSGGHLAARLLALLLTHCAHTHALAEAASEPPAVASDVTFGTAANTSTFGAQYAQYAAAAALVAGGGDDDDIVVLGRVSGRDATPVPSPLVPLLVRRMRDPKPAVRKAALQACVALALGGGSAIIQAAALVRHACEQIEAGGDGGSASAALSWARLQGLHCGVLRTARVLALAAGGAGGAGDPPSSVLGLWCIQCVSGAATDPAISVRRSALLGMHELLLAEPMQPALQTLWLATVLPLVADAEQTVSASAVDCVRAAVIDGLLGWHAHCKRAEKDKAAREAKGGAAELPALALAPPVLAWQLLDASAGDPDLGRCLSLAVAAMGTGRSQGGAAQAPLALERLVAALQQGASSTEEVTWDPRASAMVMAALDADTTMAVMGSSGVSGSSGASAVAAAGSKLTAATFRRASWLLLEILAAHFASRTLSNGGTAVAAAGSHTGAACAAFRPVLPFLIRSWGGMLKALRASGVGAARRQREHDEALLDASFSIAALEQADAEQAAGALTSDAARVLRILTLLAPGLQGEHAHGLVSSVLGDLRLFGWQPELASAGVRLAATLSACHAPSGSASAVCAATDAWAGPLIAAAEEQLHASVLRPSDLARSPEACEGALFALGEAALIGLDADAGQGMADRGAGGARASDETRRLTAVAISERLVTLVQALLSPSLAPAGAGAGAEAAVPLPDSVRAHAYLSLGKLCLRDAALAKRFVAVLVRDLQPRVCAAAAVRNNVLFVLGDLCLRYTSLVDRHAGAMAEALADPSALVRTHALALLTQLVTSDYLKWRAHVFYRFASALADPDEAVRAAAHTAITGPLLSKNRLLLQAHFVDLVFVLAGCTSHPAFAHLVQGGGGSSKGGIGRSESKANVAAADDDDGEDDDAALAAGALAAVSAQSAAAIDGQGGGGASDEVLRRLVMPDAGRRMAVFRALLAAMPEEQRFTVHGKLAVEVLGGLLEGTLRLTAPATLAQQMQLAQQAQRLRQQRAGASTSGTPARPGMLRSFTPQAAAAATDGDAEAVGTNTSEGLWFPTGSTEALVAEVFAILSSPDMRAGGAGAKAGDKASAATADDDDDAAGGGEEEGGGAAGTGAGAGAQVQLVASLAQAKGRLMAKLARKQVVENVLPICIGLKQLFAQQRSPLKAPLMAYLVGLFADFGDDVREVLSADRQTAAELEYDLRAFQQGAADLQEVQAQQAQQAQLALQAQRQSFLARPATPPATPGSQARRPPSARKPGSAVKLAAFASVATMALPAPAPALPLSPSPSIRALADKADGGRRRRKQTVASAAAAAVAVTAAAAPLVVMEGPSELDDAPAARPARGGVGRKAAAAATVAMAAAAAAAALEPDDELKSTENMGTAARAGSKGASKRARNLEAQ